MIEFNCQHCNTRLRLDDEFAGRDGWCRVCKHMVIVPSGGKAVRLEDLPPEEGYPRMQRLLSYAATKADRYKLHLAREEQEENRIRAKKDETAALTRELEVARTRIAELETESAFESVDRENAPRLTREVQELRDLAAAAQAHSSDLQLQLARREAEVDSLRGEVKQLEAALADARAQAGDKGDALDRALSPATEALQADLVRANGDIAALQTALACAQEDAQHHEAQAIEARDRADALAAQMEKLASDLVRLRESNEEISRELTGAIRREAERSPALATEVERRQAAEQRARELESTQQQHRDQLAALDTELSQVRSRENELSIALARLDATTVAKLDDAHETIAELKRELREEAERVGELTAQLAQQSDLADAARLRADMAEQTLASLQSQCATAETRANSLQEELSSARANAEESLRHSAALESELAKVRDEMRASHELAENLRTALATLKVETPPPAPEPRAGERKAERLLREQYERVLQEHETQINLNASLQEEIERFRAQTETLEAAMSELEIRLAERQVSPASVDTSPNGPPDAQEEDDDALTVEVSRREKSAPQTAGPPGPAPAGLDDAFKAYMEGRQQGDRDEVMDAFLRFLDR